ncbi:MAG: hypothetical protein WCK70_05775 [Chloroflexales bacterium]
MSGQKKRSTSRRQTRLTPLLDGIISALHHYDEEPSLDVCQRIAEPLGIGALLVIA